MDEQTIVKGLKRTVSCKVSGGRLPNNFSQTFNLEIDYNGVTLGQLLDWASAERKIAFQRIREYGSMEFIKSMAKGFSVHASRCGTKIKSRDDRVNDLVTAGWNKAVAELYVDDPAAYHGSIGMDGKGQGCVGIDTGGRSKKIT